MTCGLENLLLEPMIYSLNPHCQRVSLQPRAAGRGGKQSQATADQQLGDCHVAALLAMTNKSEVPSMNTVKPVLPNRCHWASLQVHRAVT